MVHLERWSVYGVRICLQWIGWELNKAIDIGDRLSVREVLLYCMYVFVHTYRALVCLYGPVEVSKKADITYPVWLTFLPSTLLQVWEGKQVISTCRSIIGATNPLTASPGTIRGDYGIVVGRWAAQLFSYAYNWRCYIYVIYNIYVIYMLYICYI